MKEDLPNVGLNLDPSLRYSVLVVLFVLLLVGLVGNILTLLALPYVRNKYGPQFSVLQTSTAILLLHLSFCDLFYIIVGFTHFIHVLIEGITTIMNPICYIVLTLCIDGDPFLVLGSPHSHRVCYAVAFLRNWAAEADFATMGSVLLI